MTLHLGRDIIVIDKERFRDIHNPLIGQQIEPGVRHLVTALPEIKVMVAQSRKEVAWRIYRIFSYGPEGGPKSPQFGRFIAVDEHGILLKVNTVFAGDGGFASPVDLGGASTVTVHCLQFDSKGNSPEFKIQFSTPGEELTCSALEQLALVSRVTFYGLIRGNVGRAGFQVATSEEIDAVRTLTQEGLRLSDDEVEEYTGRPLNRTLN